MKKWEYNIVKTQKVKELNKLGLEGWEAVGITALANGLPAILFKRELVEDDDVIKQLLD